MAVSDLRATVLQSINAVERKLGLTPSTTLSERSFTLVLLDLYNDVIADLADLGDWKELYTEISVTAASSTQSYSIAPASGLVHHIYDIRFGTQPAPMYQTSMADMRQLSALQSYGIPNQWAMFGVDASANPTIKVWPVPGSGQAGTAFNVAYFTQPRLYTTSDASEIPPFPATVVETGLHAAAVLEENGGEPTRQYQMLAAEYEKMKRQAINRYTSDSGYEVRMVPRKRGFG